MISSDIPQNLKDNLEKSEHPANSPLPEIYGGLAIATTLSLVLELVTNKQLSNVREYGGQPSRGHKSTLMERTFARRSRKNRRRY